MPAKQSIPSEIGASGLRQSSGYVLEELNPNLQGRQALNTWRLMTDDAVVGACLFAIDQLVRQVDWHVEQGDGKTADVQFLEECKDDMSHSWGDFVSEAFSMLPYGWALHEICYKKRSGYQPPDSKVPSSKYSDGKIGWRKIPLRSQDTLDHWLIEDSDGGVNGMVQKPPPDYKDRVIPMEKALLFRTKAYKNNPEGRSVLRSAYESWFYKKRIRQIEGTGIERDLAGFPIFWLPAEFMKPDATSDQKAVLASFETLGQNIRRDKQEYLVMPLAYDDKGNKAYDFTLANSGGQRTFNTSEIIGRYSKEIAMSVLADFILLGHESVGSFALSSDKTDLFAIAIGTFLDSIEDVINRYAVPRLFELNGMKQDNLPRIIHGDIEKPDLTELGGFITALVGAGFTLSMDEDLENYLRESANLPELSDKVKQAREKAQQQALTQPGAPGQPPGGPGTPPPGGGGQDPISQLSSLQSGRAANPYGGGGDPYGGGGRGDNGNPYGGGAYGGDPYIGGR
jgi:hypothetical protein